MEEIWKDIPGYEGKYQVSSYGRVRSLARPGPRTGKLNSQYKIMRHLENHGYYRVCLYFNGKKPKYFRIHRLVAEAFLAKDSDRNQVNHIDGNKKNNFLKNLEWVTGSENIKHAFKTKLHSLSGSRNTQAKLSESDIIHIRDEYFKGKSWHMKTTNLAKGYGVSKGTISAIVNNRGWKHV